jgi:NADH:ubiquinone oxidoreductase subunit D
VHSFFCWWERSTLKGVSYVLGEFYEITARLWAFEEREKLMEFYERVSGARMHASFYRPGGVHADIPLGLFSDFYIFIEQFNTKLIEIEEMLTDNRIWKQRLVDVGILSVKDAKDWGVITTLQQYS